MRSSMVAVARSPSGYWNTAVAITGTTATAALFSCSTFSPIPTHTLHPLHETG